MARMVLSTLPGWLQMVGQKHTSKDYVPQFAASLKLRSARFKATAEEPFFGTAPKQSKPARSIESRSFSLRWVVSLFPLPERSDRPSRKNLIFAAKLLLLLLDKRVVRSAITLVGLRNCGNCPDDPVTLSCRDSYHKIVCAPPSDS